MLDIISYIHRQELSEILSRWMIDRPEVGDVYRLKTIVNFNTYGARVWVDRFTRELMQQLHGERPSGVSFQNKGQLKDFSVAHLPFTNGRIDALVEHYHRFPEDFYRETPVDGTYYVIGSGADRKLAGLTRIKRFRRIAEKGSRRIVDFMLGRIRAGAERLAEERAVRLGVHRAHLVTPPEMMAEEFAHAERRVIKSIKHGTIKEELPLLDIPDAVGLKLILEAGRLDEVLAVLEGHPACHVIEVEPHRGIYSATNLIVEYELPLPLLASNPPSGRYLEVLASRGFDPWKVGEEYRRFLEESSARVRFEIIVSGFEDYLESEIGSCMHEERIITQRSAPDYNGALATNVRYLMTYILILCRSPRMEDYQEIPIKLWSRYMPDTIDYLVNTLAVSESLFFDAVPEIVEASPGD